MTAAFGAVEPFGYSPEAAGTFRAREQVAEYYAGLQTPVSPVDILLTASTSEAYAALFKVLCDPGDEILIPHPSYPLFEYLAALEGVRVVPYSVLYDGSWHFDTRHVAEKISGRTRAIVVVSPNNPTGSYLKQSEWEQLGQIAAAHRLPVICDEVFSEYGLTEDRRRIRTLAGTNQGLVFCLNGLSKMAGMPQMKLAWIVLAGAEAEKEEARHRLELVLDTYLSVGTPVQVALPSLLQIGGGVRKAIREVTCRHSGLLEQALGGSAAQLLHLEGGWSAIVQLPSVVAEEEWITGLLQHADVLVQPGYFFDMDREPYAIVSLLTESRTFEAGVAALRWYVDRVAGDHSSVKI